MKKGKRGMLECPSLRLGYPRQKRAGLDVYVPALTFEAYNFVFPKLH